MRNESFRSRGVLLWGCNATLLCNALEQRKKEVIAVLAQLPFKDSFTGNIAEDGGEWCAKSHKGKWQEERWGRQEVPAKVLC